MNSRAVLAVLLSWSLATTAQARDVFVDNMNGDDVRDGSSPVVSGESTGPCRSISRALQLIQGGDRLVVANRGEPYRESITLQAARHNGTPGRPFTILGNGAVLDGSQPVPLDAWRHYRADVYRFQPPRMSHQVLYLNGKPAVRRPATEPRGLPELKPLEWCLYERQIYFRA